MRGVSIFNLAIVTVLLQKFTVQNQGIMEKSYSTSVLNLEFISYIARPT